MLVYSKTLKCYLILTALQYSLQVMLAVHVVVIVYTRPSTMKFSVHIP